MRAGLGVGVVGKVAEAIVVQGGRAGFLIVLGIMVIIIIIIIIIIIVIPTLLTPITIIITIIIIRRIKFILLMSGVILECRRQRCDRGKQKANLERKESLFC